MDLTHQPDWQTQLQGCSGRYVEKVVIVTGGARGIGEGCVRTFFEAGSHVVFCDKNPDLGARLAEELNARNGTNKALFMKADVTIEADVEAVVNTAVTQFGRLDCIVNNAGWHPPHMPIDDFSVGDQMQLMQLNYMSVFAMCKIALPHLRKVTGNIINMSSMVGVFGQQGACTYAATKGAITSFSKALAIDEAKHNVRVNMVSPGNVWTPLWKEACDATDDPTGAARAGDAVQHLGRKGTTAEAGRLCLCIAADLTFTTGVDHYLAGGAELGYGVK